MEKSGEAVYKSTQWSLNSGYISYAFGVKLIYLIFNFILYSIWEIFINGSINWNCISKDSQASTNPLEINPSQECSLWNSLHFYVDPKGSTPKSQDIFSKYFVLLPFWFCENLLGFTWKDKRITWKACLDLKRIRGILWILRNT